MRRHDDDDDDDTIIVVVLIFFHIRFKGSVRPDWRCRGCVVSRDRASSCVLLNSEAILIPI